MVEYVALRNQMANLCTCFMRAANDESGGKLFNKWSQYKHDGEQVISYIREVFQDTNVAAHLPSSADQNTVAKAALERSHVDYQAVWEALKDEGLDDMVTILGRVSHMPS
ncbi:MAG: hypothetical protein AAB276_06620 [Pseudomonadota bacterium]